MTTSVSEPRRISPTQDIPTIHNETASLWGMVKELTDIDGDVLLAVLAQAMLPGATGADGATWLTADAILDYRGIRPKTHRDGPACHRAGHRGDDRAQVAASMARLEHLWLRLQDIEMLESRPNKKPTRTRYTYEGKVLITVDRLVRDGLPIAWRYAPGSWLAPFLTRPNRQTALLMQQTLRYDPYRQRWEKRLARYVTFHIRMDARNARPLARRIGTLLDELNLPVDRRHPERTRARFETALNRLTRDNVIARWGYTVEARDALVRLPARGWLEQWRATTISIVPSSRVESHYTTITMKAQQHGIRATHLNDRETH